MIGEQNALNITKCITIVNILGGKIVARVGLILPLVAGMQVCFATDELHFFVAFSCYF